LSDNFPPNHDPAIEPSPKHVNIFPISSKEKCKSSYKYFDKKGNTIVPARLMKVTKVSIQISRENPLKLSMYLRKVVFNISEGTTLAKLHFYG